MKSKITIKDIANACGVSKSTVSKALKGSHEISEETSNRIKEYAKLNDYKPNTLALKLRNQRTYTIGVLIPEIVHHFFSTVLKGIDDYANSKGYNVMICLSEKSSEKEKLSIETLLEGNVDGILMSLSLGTHKTANFEHIKKLVDNKFPLVLFDSATDTFECDKVIIDDEEGARNATEYLLNLGCKKIALITNPDFVRIGLLRKQGYINALIKNGIELDPRLIVAIDEDKNSEEQIATLFKDKNHYPDAILAINGEIYASIAMRVAKEKGLEIPKDLSVITFTDGPLSQHTTPTLSSVVQHGYQMGQEAVALLIKRIESGQVVYDYEKRIIKTNLKIRNSTKS